MKSERRHELQHNTLADWLVKSTEAIKPYQNQILAAVTLLVVCVAAYSWWSRYSSDQTTQEWNQFHRALGSGNPANLTRVMESFPNTTVSDVASLVSADEHFTKGCEQLFVSKSIGLQELKKAIDLHEKVLKRSKKQILMESATLGLARAYEACGDQESLQQATKYYDEVVNNWPKGGYAALANQRLEDLKQPEIKRLYAYLASPSFDPKPVYTGDPSKEPLPGLEGFDINNVPNDAPAGLLDSSPFDKKTNGTDKAKDKPAEKEEKSTDTTKPLNGTKPAPEKNAPEKADK